MKEKTDRKLLKWLATIRILEVPRKIFVKILNAAGMTVISYNDPERSKVFDLILKVKKENEMLLGNNEAYQIYMVVKKTEKIKGDIAEVGSYQGGSSKLICEAKGKKTLHLFDTFEGLPDLCENDNPDQFHKGQFFASLESVKRYLSKYPNVHLYKGLFPDTASPIKNKKFSFVHLDLDLYESTKAAIEFFYPRMNKGGVIISHDYIDSLGVRKAFDDFFRDKPEPIIEMSGSQCLIVKL